MKINKLEEIADASKRKVLREIYSSSIMIANCQIDKVVYLGDKIEIGGYITVPVNIDKYGFMKDFYAYYRIELDGVAEFRITSRYTFIVFYGIHVVMWIGFVVIPFISLMLDNIGQRVTYTTPDWVDITWAILTCLTLCWLLHREQTNGRRFWETMRVLYLFPVVFAILLIDWATLIPIKFISGKSTLGDDEHDYFAWED